MSGRDFKLAVAFHPEIMRIDGIDVLESSICRTLPRGSLCLL